MTTRILLWSRLAALAVLSPLLPRALVPTHSSSSNVRIRSRFFTTCASTSYERPNQEEAAPITAASSFREVALALHSTAKASRGRPTRGTDRSEVARLRRALDVKMGDADGKSLAKATWALARLDAPTLKSDAALARACAGKSAEMEPGELSLIVWAFAKSGNGKVVQSLIADVEPALRRRVNEFEARDAANLAWAVATARYRSPRLMTALARRLVAVEPQLNAQDVASIGWAYATARYTQRDPKLQSALARYVSRNATSLTAQGAANVAWAIATQRRRHIGTSAAETAQEDTRCLVALAEATRRMAMDGRLGNSQSLGLLLWSFAAMEKANIPAKVESDLFAALETAVIEASSFTARDVAACSWALATKKKQAAFPALSRAALKRPKTEWAPQSLSNVLWAFAKTGHVDTRLCLTLGSVAAGMVPRLSAQDVSNLAWAFATLGQADDALFTALARSEAVEDCAPQGIATLAWAYSRFYAPDFLIDENIKFLFRRLARLALPMVQSGQFEPRQLGTTARSFSAMEKAIDPAPLLMSAIGEQAAAHASLLNPQDLADVAEMLGRFRRTLPMAEVYVAMIAEEASLRPGALDARHRNAISRALQQTGQLRHGFFKALERSLAKDRPDPRRIDAFQPNSTRVQIVLVRAYDDLFNDDQYGLNVDVNPANTDFDGDIDEDTGFPRASLYL